MKLTEKLWNERTNILLFINMIIILFLAIRIENVITRGHVDISGYVSSDIEQGYSDNIRVEVTNWPR